MIQNMQKNSDLPIMVLEDKIPHMQKKVLITGITGFAGSYLAESLCKKETYQVFGTYLSDESLRNVSAFKNSLHLSKIDLTERKQVYEVIAQIKPDFVYHLAALTSPGDSFKNPTETITNNVTLEVNILEAIKEAKLLNTKIMITSSAYVYGAVSSKELPIDENTSFHPTNPYAVSKITQDYLGLQYFITYKMPIVRVRPFNHIGPRQSPSFVVASFAKKIAEIEKKGKESVLYVGNIETKRDFTDVRDMVKAYELALEKGEIGDVYNIGSGKSYKISKILEKLLSFSKTKITVQVDESLFRLSETLDLVCDSTKFRKKTGWKPEIFIDKTLKETLDYWRAIV